MICISLIISDFEYFSSVCWPIVYLLQRIVYLCPQPSFYWDYLFIFFLLICLSSLQILYIIPLSDVQIVKIFSHSVGCLFILLIVSFAVQKLFSISKSQLLIIVSVCLFVCFLEMECQTVTQPGVQWCGLSSVKFPPPEFK